MIIGISRDRLSSVWHIAQPLLKKAFDRVDYPFTLDDILGKIDSRDMQLWMTSDLKMAWLTRILVFPRYNVLEVVAGGGSGLDAWLAPWDELCTAFATQHGCKYIEVQGRPGWSKVGQPLGYVPVWTTIRKEV